MEKNTRNYKLGDFVYSTEFGVYGQIVEDPDNNDPFALDMCYIVDEFGEKYTCYLEFIVTKDIYFSPLAKAMRENDEESDEKSNKEEET